ncbi:uncharacterized protein LOC144661438 [Oculina patagonica]
MISSFSKTLHNTSAHLETARKMYLETLSPGTLKSVADARNLYITWHSATYDKRVEFPLKDIDLKAFVISLAKAGFSYTRIVNNIFRGVCMWQISNDHQSPAKQYPELGSTISKYVRKEVGEGEIFPKRPMFQQDIKHILDTIGIDTPASLQLSLIHSMSSFCGARSNTMSTAYVRPEILELRETIGLDPYPDALGVKVGDVEFRSEQELGVTMVVAFTHEKNDAANRSHKMHP